MKNTLRKYKKRSLHKKTIKLRHKKYRGGMDVKVKKVVKKTNGLKKEFKI